MKNSSTNVNGSKKQRTEDKTQTRSLMLDFDVLDCPVCYETLTVPIFQCENGHLACSSCFPKLSNKCPSCDLSVGHIRCRAMESVIESAFVPCRNAKFGCTNKLFLGKESTHEKECSFSQCSCPAQDCIYTCSYKDLFAHYQTHMKGYRTRFKVYMTIFRSKYIKCGISSSVKMNISDKIRIFKNIRRGVCFAVQCFRESYGVYVTVSCIAPRAPEVGRFSSHLSYTVCGHTMSYESPEVEMILEVSYQTPKENFMLIPNSLLRGELLKMELCIKEVVNQE